MMREHSLLLLTLGLVCLTPIITGQPEMVADEPALSADAKIVRQLLDENGLQDVSVPRVAVQREGRVVELKLYGKKTSSQNLPKSLHAIPPAIGKLDKLEKLILASNELPELPETIYDLDSLTELDLSNNTLESLSPKIGNLKQLRKLDLMMNQLVEVPADIGGIDRTHQPRSHGEPVTLAPRGDRLAAQT
jgi:hypothetical protein